jgi:hypothetical protein
MQYYVIKFVSDLQQVRDFRRFPPPMKVPLNTITLYYIVFMSLQYKITILKTKLSLHKITFLILSMKNE